MHCQNATKTQVKTRFLKLKSKYNSRVHYLSKSKNMYIHDYRATRLKLCSMTLNPVASVTLVRLYP